MKTQRNSSVYGSRILAVAIVVMFLTMLIPTTNSNATYNVKVNTTIEEGSYEEDAFFDNTGAIVTYNGWMYATYRLYESGNYWHLMQSNNGGRTWTQAWRFIDYQYYSATSYGTPSACITPQGNVVWVTYEYDIIGYGALHVFKSTAIGDVSSGFTHTTIDNGGAGLTYRYYNPSIECDSSGNFLILGYPHTLAVVSSSLTLTREVQLTNFPGGMVKWSPVGGHKIMMGQGTRAWMYLPFANYTGTVACQNFTAFLLYTDDNGVTVKAWNGTAATLPITETNIYNYQYNIYKCMRNDGYVEGFQVTPCMNLTSGNPQLGYLDTKGQARVYPLTHYIYKAAKLVVGQINHATKAYTKNWQYTFSSGMLCNGTMNFLTNDYFGHNHFIGQYFNWSWLSPTNKNDTVHLYATGSTVIREYFDSGKHDLYARPFVTPYLLKDKNTLNLMVIWMKTSSTSDTDIHYYSVSVQPKINLTNPLNNAVMVRPDISPTVEFTKSMSTTLTQGKTNLTQGVVIDDFNYVGNPNTVIWGFTDFVTVDGSKLVSDVTWGGHLNSPSYTANGVLYFKFRADLQIEQSASVSTIRVVATAVPTDYLQFLKLSGGTELNLEWWNGGYGGVSVNPGAGYHTYEVLVTTNKITLWIDGAYQYSSTAYVPSVIGHDYYISNTFGAYTSNIVYVDWERLYTGVPSVVKSWVGRTLTLNPASNLAYNSEHYIIVENDSKSSDLYPLDGNANDFNDYQNDYSFTYFTTHPIPPVISSTSPSTGLTGVPYNTNIVIKFSKAMSPSSVLANTYITPYFASTLSWDAYYKNLTIDPTPLLAYNQLYTIKVEGDTLATDSTTLDGNANGIMDGTPTDDYSFSFTTALQPPVVTTIQPAKWSEDKPFDTYIITDFSAVMNQGITNSNSYLYQATLYDTFSYTSGINTSKWTRWDTDGTDLCNADELALQSVAGVHGISISPTSMKRGSELHAYVRWKYQSISSSYAGTWKIYGVNGYISLSGSPTPTFLRYSALNGSTPYYIDISPPSAVTYHNYHIIWNTTGAYLYIDDVYRAVIPIANCPPPSTAVTLYMLSPTSASYWDNYDYVALFNTTTSSPITKAWVNPTIQTLTASSGVLVFESCYMVKYSGTAQNTLGTTLDGNNDGVSSGTPIDDYTSFFTVATKPPAISTTNPLPGATGVPIAANIIIQFTKAVTNYGVGWSSYLTITPPLAISSYTLSGGGTILTIDPSVNMQYSTLYTIKLYGTILGTNGVTFDGNNNMESQGSPTDDYTFTFTTYVLPPTVTSTIPIDNKGGVSPKSSITITFSKNMNTASVQAAFSITPSAAGSFIWTGLTMVTYDPTSPLSLSQNYIIKILGSAQDSAGQTLDGDGDFTAEGTPIDDYIFNFTTAAGIWPPVVDYTSPASGATNVVVTSTIIIEFSQPMNQATVESSFQSSPLISGKTYVWRADSQRVTISHSTRYTYDTLYTITLWGSTARDADGLYLDGNKDHVAGDDYSWTFRTELAPATVISHTPIVSATMVIDDLPSIIITFSKAMNTATLSGNLVTAPTISLGTPVWSLSNTRVTLPLTHNLTFSTIYTIRIKGTMQDYEFKGLDGDSDGISESSPLDDYVWTFITEERPPHVLNSNPLPGAIDFPITNSIHVNFSKSMDTSTVTSLWSIAPTRPGSFAWYSSNRYMVWTPTTPFQYSTSYLITLSGNIRDSTNYKLDGNGNDEQDSAPTDNYLISFTTTAVPQISSTTPTEGELHFPVANNIIITFTKPMNAASVITNMTITPSFSYGYAWTVGDTILTLNPATNLPVSTAYTIKIPGNVIDYLGMTLDGNHNGLSQGTPTDDFYLHFTTSSLPQVTSTIPINSATGVSPIVQITITFSQQMDQPSVISNLILSPTFPYDVDSFTGGTVLKFTPTYPLAYSATYNIAIKGLAQDVYGNYFDGDKDGVQEGPYDNYTFRFTVQGPPPTITNVTPYDGQTNVRKNATVTISFDKSMDRTTTIAALTISPSIYPVYTWGYQNRSLNISVVEHPAYWWDYQTLYSISIHGTAVDINGTGLDNNGDGYSGYAGEPAYTWTFVIQNETYGPQIVSVSPADDEAIYQLPVDIIIEYTDDGYINLTRVFLIILIYDAEGNLNQTINATSTSFIFYDHILYNFTGGNLTDGGSVEIRLHLEDNDGYSTDSITTFIYYDSEYMAFAHNFTNTIISILAIILVLFCLYMAIRLMGGNVREDV